ncbi:MAG: transcriptional repressor LexA [Actinobacteria bacterium]|nr:transcriptional repressor LexA [Actinomycetota bacterium]MBU4217639.1 transcriptional repressor LexA [Actinomycetota bacterium]MCG2818098.1 transcriptional repressor LexA [Actinomycetes bacterium]
MPGAPLDFRFLFGYAELAGRPGERDRDVHEITPTRRQVELLEFLERFRRMWGYSPTLREIAKGLGLSSVATVAEHLDGLESRGLIRRQRDRSRAVLLTAGGHSVLTGREGANHYRDGSVVIGLLGTIAAGEPIEAAVVPEEIEVPAAMASGRCFALKVKGQSMIGEGILDGDYVVVEEKPVPENGETVVALIDGSEATLKKFYAEEVGGIRRIRLQPANPRMEPIVLTEGDRLEVQGAVRGILRLL